MLATDDPFRDDIRQISRISEIPLILDACRAATGMGFTAIARVTEDRCVTCASLDEVDFDLLPGDELDVGATICQQVRGGRATISVPDVEASETYHGHEAPKQYGARSYISVPIIRTDNRFWGTLCAIDKAPSEITEEAEKLFELFAQLIALELDRQEELEMGRATLASERDTARLREEFIAIVGHDLRNPIAAVSAGLRMMAERDLSSERTSDLILEMQRALTRANQIITNLMDFARGRLGAGIELRNLRPVDLGPVFSDVVNEIMQVATQPLESDIDLPDPIVADPQRLGQLLSNLLGNAVTHGDRSQPIRVRGFERSGELTLSVNNRGEPIPDAVRASLFQPFSRSGKQSSLQGLGLGLYIAAEIARAHDGELTVESTSAAGTTFTLRMPTRAQ